MTAYTDVLRDSDRLWLKVFVSGIMIQVPPWSRARRLGEHWQVLVLFAFDTLNTALDVATVYVPLVNEFGEHRLLR